MNISDDPDLQAIAEFMASGRSGTIEVSAKGGEGQRISIAPAAPED